jgi:pyroglutamyl-peptidase
LKVLVTGFAPFAGRSSNPTEELIMALRKEGISVPVSLTLKTLILPVTYDTSVEMLLKSIHEFSPDVILSFGQAAKREGIELERIAINCIDSELEDNQGKIIQDQKIVEKGEDGLFTTFHLPKLKIDLAQAGFKVEISNTAGTYVCNLIYYHALRETRGSVSRCLFIHVPLSPAPQELIRFTEALLRLM